MKQRLERYRPTEYYLIHKTITAYSYLLLKEDSFRVDLETYYGQHLFRVYMSFVEQLIYLIGVRTINRDFRMNYTQAYRVLYPDVSLGYIPYIFDSAQEAYGFIYVNGDKYDFSGVLLNRAEALVEAYFLIIHLMKFMLLRADYSALVFPDSEINQLKNRLFGFDKAWVEYENQYISELIDIEKTSKEKIMQMIRIQTQLKQYETNYKMKGKIFLSGTYFHALRRELCEVISRLNSVANIDGKGRDDLTYDILLAAENVLNTVTSSQSKSVRNMAETIRQSFYNVREVLQYFSMNFDVVDPQLRNNPYLVAALMQYERSWYKGKRYFLEYKKYQQIIAFSSIVDAAREKYPHFRELVYFSDPSIFWIIPSLILLGSLEGEDEGLAYSFLQSVDFKNKCEDYANLKSNYSLWKQGNPLHKYQAYNIMEYLLIHGMNLYTTKGTPLPIDTLQGKDEKTTQLLTNIKTLGVSLYRISPIDWNDMLSVLLNEQID